MFACPQKLRPTRKSSSKKRLFANAVSRLTGSNLLDRSKDEVFDKFADRADQTTRTCDQYELETESAGPVSPVVMRLALQAEPLRPSETRKAPARAPGPFFSVSGTVAGAKDQFG